jgi:hypothetical protein
MIEPVDQIYNSVMKLWRRDPIPRELASQQAAPLASHQRVQISVSNFYNRLFSHGVNV